MLRRFTAYYVGTRRVAGLDLPTARTLVINRGGYGGTAAECLFKLSGIAPQCYRQMARLNPVLIHAQFGLSGALALPWARAMRIPLVVHYRGADAMPNTAQTRYASLNHWVYFRRLHALQRDTHLFITVSQFLKDKLIKQGFPAHKIVHHYHGVDVDRFRPNPDIPREPVVLFVGRMTEKKAAVISSKPWSTCNRPCRNSNSSASATAPSAPNSKLSPPANYATTNSSVYSRRKPWYIG